MIRIHTRSQLVRLGMSLWLVLGFCLNSWGQQRKPRFYAWLTQPRQYVLLSDSLGPVHHVQAQQGGYSYVGLLDASYGDARGQEGPIHVPQVTVELLNLLVPATRRPLDTTPAIAAAFPKGDTLLLTFSLLPDTSGVIRWEPVSLDTLPVGRCQSLTQAVREAGARIAAYRAAGSPGEHTLLCRDDLVPLVRRGDTYWAPQAYVLTEYYQIHTQASTAFPAKDLATINIRSRPFPTDKLLQEARLKKNNPHASLYAVPTGNLLQSRTDNRYEFWSNPAVWISHAPLLHYGNGGFVYQPRIGLVSARYTFYFELAPTKVRQAVDNEFFEVKAIDGKTIR
jgi:hypothetical protein